MNKKSAAGVRKGLVAGFVGGQAASAVMNQFQPVWARLAGDRAERRHSNRTPRIAPANCGDEAVTISSMIPRCALATRFQPWCSTAIGQGVTDIPQARPFITITAFRLAALMELQRNGRPEYSRRRSASGCGCQPHCR
jgi:hypothetical protein